MRLINDFFNIEKCEGNTTEITCDILLNANHFIYQAHFPENPITPGVCIVQIAQEIMENHTGKTLMLSVLNNIKFMQVLQPTVTPSVQYRISSSTTDSGDIKIKVSVSNGNTIYSKFTATYTPV